ncbi:helix-turn-helix domain-containing protein [Virgibacillus sp. CBA3643]|uniref:helix-turn-helix domain-containing protein n=1 Tax=Virgibacillus sp. CBA3643 TaxID=2942278 RepID=UPI0035A2CACE
MELHNNIKILIIQQGYKSVQEFAKKNGISYYMVRKLANNEANGIDINLLVDLCRAFNCEIGDIFFINKAS